MRGSAPALLVVLLLAGCVSRAAAEENEPPETIRVEGQGDRDLDDLTGAVTVIHAEEFQSRITTLAELLQETAGLHVRSFGGLGSFATVSIRGSTSEQVNVYLDGVPLNPALGGGVDLADLSLAGIEAIEIYRGFTPAFLPSGSIGGAINIRTKRPARAANGEISGPEGSGALSYGSYDTVEANGSAAWHGRRADRLVTLGFLRSSGDFRFFDDNGTQQVGGDDGFETRRNNRFWEGNLMARSIVRTEGSGRFDLQAGLTSRRQGVPGIDAFQSERARAAMSRALLRAGWGDRSLAGESLKLDLDLQFLRTAQEFEDRLGDSTGGFTTDVRRLLDSAGPTALLRWHPRSSPAAGHFVTMLASLRRETAHLLDRLDGDSDRGTALRFVSAVSLEDEIHLAGGRVILGPSARWDRVSSRFTGQDDLLDSRLTGRLGAAWHAHPRLSFRAGAGRFHREPSLLEMFGDQGSIRGGGAGLRPEVGWSYDGGLSFEAPPSGPLDRLHLDAGLFRRDADDLIQLVLTSQRQAVAVNTGRARVTGAELAARLGLFGWLGGIVSYTWQVAEDRSDTFRKGSDLPGRPRHVVSARATASRAWGRPFYEFEYVGPNYFDAAAAAIASGGGSGIGRDLYRVPGRYLHGIGFTRIAGSHLEYTVEVDNLFNVKTVDVARYPLPGRLVQAKLRVTLP